jgi:hypothetical protein
MDVFGVNARPSHAKWYQRFVETAPINNNKYQFLKYVRDNDIEIFESLSIKYIDNIEEFVLLCTAIPSLDVDDFAHIGRGIKDFGKCVKKWSNVISKVCSVNVIKYVLKTYDNCLATIVNTFATERLSDLPKIIRNIKIDDTKDCGCHIFTKMETKVLPHLAANGVYTIVADSLHDNPTNFSLLKPYIKYISNSYLTLLSNDLIVYLYIVNCKTKKESTGSPESDFMNIFVSGLTSYLQSVGDNQ